MFFSQRCSRLDDLGPCFAQRFWLRGDGAFGFAGNSYANGAHWLARRIHRARQRSNSAQKTWHYRRRAGGKSAADFAKKTGGEIERGLARNKAQRPRACRRRVYNHVLQMQHSNVNGLPECSRNQADQYLALPQLLSYVASPTDVNLRNECHRSA